MNSVTWCFFKIHFSQNLMSMSLLFIENINDSVGSGSFGRELCTAILARAICGSVAV